MSGPMIQINTRMSESFFRISKRPTGPGILLLNNIIGIVSFIINPTSITIILWCRKRSLKYWIIGVAWGLTDFALMQYLIFLNVRVPMGKIYLKLTNS